MLSQLKTGKRVVGIKQARRAVESGTVKAVFTAADCDPQLLAALVQCCAAHEVELISVPSMKELGAACGIQVGAAAAALLEESGN